MSAPHGLGWLLGMLLVVAPPGLAAQRTWQADIRIRALDVHPVGQGSLSVRIQVSTGDGEPAQASRLEVLIPVGIEVVRLSAGCRPSPSAVSGVSGRVTCELGDLAVRGLHEVTLVTSRPPAGSGARFAAFVVSNTPDPVPANNFAERVVQ